MLDAFYLIAVVKRYGVGNWLADLIVAAGILGAPFLLLLFAASPTIYEV